MTHRRRKILKVGGAKDMIACAKRARKFQTMPTLGQTAPIFEQSMLLRLDFLHKERTVSQVEQIWLLLSHILMPS